MQNQVQGSISLLLKETQQSTYFEKYHRWKNLLASFNGQQYLVVLTNFLDYFPFNASEWLEYINLTGPESYQTALKRNSKSYELWEKYLEYLRKYEDSDGQAKYKKQLTNAIKQIGADTRTFSLYMEYYLMLDKKYHYDFYKKIMTRALPELQKIYEKFLAWIDSQTMNELQIIIAKQTKGKKIPEAEYKQFIIQQIYQTYQKTLKYREKRMSLESQIKCFYFEGNQEVLAEDMQIWKELISIERQNGVVQNTSYAYERMLMAQTHDIDLWEEVFYYLENQTNKYAKVLNIFRFNSVFFVKFSIDLYLYWCDLQERQNPNQARKMYQQLEKHQKKLEVYLRHIQFEIRQKKWDNAKAIFDTLVAENQSDSQQVEFLCYILVEYANYIVKYYKDYDYPRKLLKGYFEYLPYNNHLFTSYLHFMRYNENKQGYYDDLMEIIQFGVKKAKSSLHDEQFSRVIKMVKHYLRSVLSSIYLIKMSQRKILEVVEKVTKEQLS